MRTKMFRKGSLPFISIIILGAFLRLFLLNKNDLWYDEAATLFLARNTSFIWDAPLYYILTKVWVMLFGISEFAIRLPAAIFSIAALPLTYILSKKLFDKRVALFSLCLISLSPFHIWYAQEARNFTLALFLGLYGSLTLFLWRESVKNKWLIMYVMITALGIYSSYYYLLFYFAQIIFIVSSRIGGRKKIVFTMVGFFLFFPWLPTFFKKLFFIKNGFWLPQPSSCSLIITLENFIMGYNGTKILYVFGAVLITVSLGIAGTVLFRGRPKNEKLDFCFILLVFPLAAAFMFSRLVCPVYLDRGFLLLSPYFYILMGYSFFRISLKSWKLLIIFAVAVTLIIANYRYFTNQIFMPDEFKYHMGVLIKKPFKPLAEFLKRKLKRDDYLVFGNHYPSYSLAYYLRLNEDDFSSLSCYVFDPEIIDTIWRRPYQNLYGSNSFFISKHNVLGILRKRGAKRLLFIGSDWSRSGNLDENSKSINEYLSKNLKLAKNYSFDGIQVYVYEFTDKDY